MSSTNVAMNKKFIAYTEIKKPCDCFFQRVVCFPISGGQQVAPAGWQNSEDNGYWVCGVSG